jgi:pyridoxine 5'-phosphate synthase PdxJ
LEDIKHNAIINALQKDYSFWLESIKKLSGGMDIQHLRKEINDLETSMQTNYIATDVWIDSQEKFYEWKRELNICKIEVESLALPNIENQNKYYEYQKAFNFLAKISFINPQITLPLFVKVGEIFNHEIDFNDLDNLNIDQNIFLLKFVD